MASRKSEPPFWYQRNNFRFRGQTDQDRRSMRLETILYWTYRILLALAALIFAITRLLNFLDSTSPKHITSAYSRAHSNYIHEVSSAFGEVMKVDAPAVENCHNRPD